MERLTLRDDDGRALLTPYGLQIYCSTQATADCICKLEEALQAAQEPRVMTLGEVMALEEGTGDVWIEDAPMPYTSHWIEAVTLVDKTDWQETDEVTFSNEITYHPTSYRLNTAQGWRCWTGRPTEEQREAMAWE